MTRLKRPIKANKKRKARAPVKTTDREFSSIENGTLYHCTLEEHEKPSSVASALNARARALNLNKDIVKFRPREFDVVITPEGFNLWRPYTKQKLDSDPVVTPTKLKPIRLYARPFSQDNEEGPYIHVPEKGTDVTRLMRGFNLKAKGLRLDLDVVKFYLNSDKNICLSSAGYQLWIESFARQKQKPISVKDRVFTSSKDGTYFEHFTDADLYIVARDFKIVVAKLNLSKAVRFVPNFKNGSVMITSAGYQEWSNAMMSYRSYHYTAATNNNNNIADGSQEIALSEQDLLDLENEMFLDDVYDLDLEQGYNETVNEFAPIEEMQTSEFAALEVPSSPPIFITPWSPNYYGPRGLFSPPQNTLVQPNDLFDLNCDDVLTKK